ncbi:MAG: hypothetical protein XU11_C0034G0005 [Candidatus Dadabacteria bacterium CSP1-2]|jgi:hypothetical protein|nr:MAG: hypothetical protein XU11_C0034G0005 [Candidatus Dadabacteria bacterium CSP1-2]
MDFKVTQESKEKIISRDAKFCVSTSCLNVFVAKYL